MQLVRNDKKTRKFKLSMISDKGVSQDEFDSFKHQNKCEFKTKQLDEKKK